MSHGSEIEAMARGERARARGGDEMAHHWGSTEANEVAGRGRAADVGIQALRLGAGGLLAGHGAQ
ncbi:MAG: hypothetical protein M3462_07835 [Chloroflexota bacterium]|nr:hypothetical protein [Chloroflexota bacterium]